MNESLQRHETQATALELKFTKAILKASPGIGEKAQQIAQQIVDSGLPASLSIMLINTVYAPTVADGRGQSTRIKWFMESVRRRYGDRLERAKTHIPSIRTILAELEEITEMRDILKGESASLSFEQAFALYELGYDAETLLGILNSLEMPTRGGAMARLSTALKRVMEGHAPTLESALDFLA